MNVAGSGSLNSNLTRLRLIFGISRGFLGVLKGSGVSFLRDLGVSSLIRGDLGEFRRHIPCLVGEVGGVAISSLSSASLRFLLGGERDTGSVSECFLFIRGTGGMAGSGG